MKISVIIPTLNEERILEKTLASLSGSGGDEVIVVDGGSVDATVEIARGFAHSILSCEPGRAQQMNAGAAAAKGDVLLFLHADTILPHNAFLEIRKALSDVSVVGGRFDVRFEESRGLLFLVSYLMNLRSRLTGIATGDQAIFVRREVFFQIRGFPDIPLMEDVAFSKAMKKAGKVVCLRSQVITSARRWKTHGALKTILLMWWLRLLYFCGISPHRLKKAYQDVR